MIEKKLNHRIISVILGHKDSDIPQEQEKKISDTNVDTSWDTSLQQYSLEDGQTPSISESQKNPEKSQETSWSNNKFKDFFLWWLEKMKKDLS